MLQFLKRRTLVRFKQFVLRSEVFERLKHVPTGRALDRIRRIAFRLKSLADGAQQEIALDNLFELAPLSSALLDRSLDRINVQEPSVDCFDRVFDVLNKL